MLSTIAKVLIALVLVASGAMVGTAVTGSFAHLVPGAPASASLTPAEQAAIAYVDAHYPGNGTAKILKVDNNTENDTGAQVENNTENYTGSSPDNSTQNDTGSSVDNNTVNGTQADVSIGSQNETEHADNASSENDANVSEYIVLAPNGHVYDVEVNTTTDTVISAELSDYQPGSTGSGDSQDSGSSSDSGTQSTDS